MSAEEHTFYRLAERLADYDGWIDCEQLMPAVGRVSTRRRIFYACARTRRDGNTTRYCTWMNGRWRGRLERKSRVTHWQFPLPFPAKEILRFKRAQSIADAAPQSERPPFPAFESARSAVNLALAGWLLLGAAWIALLIAPTRRDMKPEERARSDHA